MMGRTVASLQDEMDSAEFTEWQAYYHLFPFGEERADLRSGIIAATIAQTHGAKLTATDFMPEFGSKKPKSADELQNVLMDWANSHNAAVKK